MSSFYLLILLWLLTKIKMFNMAITYIVCRFVCFDESTYASSMPHCAIAVTDVTHVCHHSGDGRLAGGTDVWVVLMSSLRCKWKSDVSTMMEQLLVWFHPNTSQLVTYIGLLSILGTIFPCWIHCDICSSVMEVDERSSHLLHSMFVITYFIF